MANAKSKEQQKEKVVVKAALESSPSPPPELSEEKLKQLKRFAHLCNLIGDKSASRTSIIYLLSLGPSTPGEIAVAMKLSASGVSQHINKLANAGLINGERHAQKVVYTIDSNLREEFESLTAEVL
jgi:DNA-binding MarR family transcriptional regulator